MNDMQQMRPVRCKCGSVELEVRQTYAPGVVNPWYIHCVICVRDGAAARTKKGSISNWNTEMEHKMKCHDCNKPITGKGHFVTRQTKPYGAIPKHKAVVVCRECAGKGK